MAPWKYRAEHRNTPGRAAAMFGKGGWESA